jgi:hypothetical protein
MVRSSRIEIPAFLIKNISQITEWSKGKKREQRPGSANLGFGFKEA